MQLLGNILLAKPVVVVQVEVMDKEKNKKRRKKKNVISVPKK
jgi:hypothetical protein